MAKRGRLREISETPLLPLRVSIVSGMYIWQISFYYSRDLPIIHKIKQFSKCHWISMNNISNIDVFQVFNNQAFIPNKRSELNSMLSDIRFIMAFVNVTENQMKGA
jgi:hypothetical protein